METIARTFESVPHSELPEYIGGPFIVAEVSKNWRNGRSVEPTPLLAVQFEAVINYNAARGYELATFQVHRQLTSPFDMNETIVAVFKRKE